VANLAKFFESLKTFNLTDEDEIQGFEPDEIFSRKISIVKYDKFFTRIIEERREIYIDPSKEKEKSTSI